MFTYIKNIWIAFVNLIKTIIIYKFNLNIQNVYQDLRALDRLGNAVGDGLPTMTISQRASLSREDYKAGKNKRIWGCVCCRILDWLDPYHIWPFDHCKFAITGDNGSPLDLTKVKK